MFVLSSILIIAVLNLRFYVLSDAAALHGMNNVGVFVFVFVLFCFVVFVFVCLFVFTFYVRDDTVTSRNGMNEVFWTL